MEDIVQIIEMTWEDRRERMIITMTMIDHTNDPLEGRTTTIIGGDPLLALEVHHLLMTRLDITTVELVV